MYYHHYQHHSIVCHEQPDECGVIHGRVSDVGDVNVAHPHVHVPVQGVSHHAVPPGEVRVIRAPDVFGVEPLHVEFVFPGKLSRHVNQKKYE